MTTWITDIISSLGYIGVGVLMFVENLWPPIPSEVIMPLAGFTAAKGEMNILFVIISGTIGATLGTLLWYFIGHFLGKERIEKFLDHHGKWLTLSRKDIERADYWFDHHNEMAVFIGRLIPGIRTVISLPAGISGMRFLPFLIWTTLGTALWTTLLALAGYFLYEKWSAAGHYIGFVVPILLILLFLWYLFRLFKQFGEKH